MPLDTPTLEGLTTVAGAAIIVSILVGVVIKAWKPTEEQKDRFGPLIALGLGVVVSVVATLGLGIGGTEILVQAVLTGLVAGATAMGLHDTIGLATG